jgi:hypothetical protein
VPPRITQEPCGPFCAELSREELDWLKQLCVALNYYTPTPMGRGRYAAINQFLFTFGIIVGDIGDNYGYRDRYCFERLEVALAALAEWSARSFEGEPLGWHRHPDSGRRRPDGDPSREYINH